METVLLRITPNMNKKSPQQRDLVTKQFQLCLCVLHSHPIILPLHLPASESHYVFVSGILGGTIHSFPCLDFDQQLNSSTWQFQWVFAVRRENEMPNLQVTDYRHCVMVCLQEKNVHKLSPGLSSSTAPWWVVVHSGFSLEKSNLFYYYIFIKGS